MRYPRRMKRSAAIVGVFVAVSALAADAAPPKAPRLRKAELRPTMKALFPRLTKCYERALARDPKVSGVINTMLKIRNEPGVGLTMRVTGFETHGPLGDSPEFLKCVTATFEAKVLPPVATRGVIDITYPGTFARQSPDGRDSAIVDAAARAADQGRWSEALADAERGLLLTSLDGPFRRRLIEIAGLSACHLRDEPKARYFFSLASPEFEDRVQQTCLEAATIDLWN